MILLFGCSVEKGIPQQEETVTDPAPSTVQPQELQDEQGPEYPSSQEEPEEASLPTREVPSDEQFVKVTDYIPTISVDLKYATTDNFTGLIIYTFSEVYLRYGTVKKLSKDDSLSGEAVSVLENTMLKFPDFI